MPVKFNYTLLSCLFLMATASSAFGQQPPVLQIKFAPVFKNVSLQAGKSYYIQNADSVQITNFKLYVSNFRLYKKSKEVAVIKNSYYLLDISKPESFTRFAAIPAGIDFDEVQFYFGIDDITNNNGVGEGDLDPANDMYWAWQTGYINMKLEGSYGVTQKPFEFHLGGFLKPYASFKEVHVSVNQKDIVNIGINLSQFFENIDLKSCSAVMSPGEKGVVLSGRAALMFYSL